MSDNSLNKTFADFSLTYKTLNRLSNLNKNKRVITTFVCVHVVGSAFLLGAGVADTLIQTAAVVVTLFTGLIATPLDGIRSFTGKPPLLKAWNWKMTIVHLGSAIDRALSLVIIVVENFFVGPERTREDFFKCNMEIERSRIAKHKLAELENAERKKISSPPITPQPYIQDKKSPVTTPYRPLPKIPYRCTPAPALSKPQCNIPFDPAKSFPTTHRGVPPPPPPFRPTPKTATKILKFKTIDTQDETCMPILASEKIHELRSHFTHVDIDQLLQDKKNAQAMLNPAAKLISQAGDMLAKHKQINSSSSSESRSGWDD